LINILQSSNSPDDTWIESRDHKFAVSKILNLMFGQVRSIELSGGGTNLYESLLQQSYRIYELSFMTTIEGPDNQDIDVKIKCPISFEYGSVNLSNCISQENSGAGKTLQFLDLSQKFVPNISFSQARLK